jgi:rare lipoprotein A
MARIEVRRSAGVILRISATGSALVILAQCSQLPSDGRDPKYGVSASPRLVALGDPVPKGGGTYRVGKPYVIGGRTYEPQENTRYSAEGLASWYGEDFHGRATANGEVYDMTSISAAHPTLPIPSYARVTNLTNQKSIVVRVNDRGPYHADRLIDVSVRTAKLLDFYDRGTTRVRVDYVGRAALEGSDDTKLAATLRSGTPAPGPSEVRMASSPPVAPYSAIKTVPAPTDRRYEPGHTEITGRVVSPAVNEIAAITRQPIAPVAPPKTTAAAAPKSANSPAIGSAAPDQHGFAARFAPGNKLPAVPSTNEAASAFAGPPTPNHAVLNGRGLY